MPSSSCHSFQDDDSQVSISGSIYPEAPATRPSRLSHGTGDSVLELLEKLDDVLFEAIRGCPESLSKAETLWPKTVDRLGWSVVEESREQYLRYANDILGGKAGHLNNDKFRSNKKPRGSEKSNADSLSENLNTRELQVTFQVIEMLMEETP